MSMSSLLSKFIKKEAGFLEGNNQKATAESFLWDVMIKQMNERVMIGLWWCQPAAPGSGKIEEKPDDEVRPQKGLIDHNFLLH